MTFHRNNVQVLVYIKTSSLKGCTVRHSSLVCHLGFYLSKRLLYVIITYVYYYVLGLYGLHRASLAHRTAREGLGVGPFRIKFGHFVTPGWPRQVYGKRNQGARWVVQSGEAETKKTAVRTPNRTQ
eukprot:1184644-Prorocentrum_minimum.AAC.2